MRNAARHRGRKANGNPPLDSYSHRLLLRAVSALGPARTLALCRARHAELLLTAPWLADNLNDAYGCLGGDRILDRRFATHDEARELVSYTLSRVVRLALNHLDDKHPQHGLTGSP